MHRRLLILFSQVDLSARSILLSAESFTWEVMVAQKRYHDFPSTVTERNDYHPYGARHSNSSLTKASGNRWRFSGKEEFDDAFGLPQSDFGERFYDRAAWSSLDPLAEKYYSLSPYAFCAGNVRAAIFDGAGIAIDAVAAAIPFVPGGVGVIRSGAKLVDAADNLTDAVKTTVKVHGNSKLSTKAQHAYDIIDIETNTIVKTGVSSGPINKNNNLNTSP